MERKIGETFEFKGKTYEVAELPEYFCAFCDLEKECYSKRSYVMPSGFFQQHYLTVCTTR